MTLDEVTVVIVPGLRDHVPEHWQTLLARRLPRSRTVPPLTERKLDRTARAQALQDTLADVQGQVVLVAHSAGVMITAHWARAHRRADIVGALLATPADLERPLPEGYPSPAQIEAGGWLPVPRAPLPFPSILAASRDDPLASLERVQGFARDWGSRLFDIGAVGHLNPASGYGEWPQALELIHQLITQPARAQ